MQTAKDASEEITLARAAMEAECAANFARSKAREGAIQTRELGNGMRLTKRSQVAVLRKLKAAAIERRGRRSAEHSDAASR